MSIIPPVEFLTRQTCSRSMLFCNLLLCVPSLQNVCTPEVRGSAFAIFSLTDDIGKGLGPGKTPAAS
jgi:hypothetical protein